MNGERLKQLLRSKWARWIFAAGLVVKLALVGMAVLGAMDHAQAAPMELASGR